MKRHKTTGATLIEVMVVSTIFFVVLAAIVSVYLTTVRVDRQVDLKSDIDRTLLAAVRHVDSSLKSSRLVSPVRPDAWTPAVAVTELELQPLKLNADGSPAVTAEGFPEWEPAFTISYKTASGELVRTISGNDRVLAKLGPEGSLTFIRPIKGMLEMHVKIKKKGVQGYETSRESTFQFRLFNQ